LWAIHRWPCRVYKAGLLSLGEEDVKVCNGGLTPQALYPRPKFMGFHMSGPATRLDLMPNRDMVKAEKRDLFQSQGQAVGGGRVSTQPIFSHLWGTDMSLRFK
jgi:hypothetical protein